MDEARHSGRALGFERVHASLIVIRGPDEGEEHRVGRPRWLLGRGPGVDAAFDDARLSRQHAALEFELGRFRLRGLDRENRVQVNGSAVDDCELAHGDRIAIGERVFQILIEEGERPL